MDLYTSRYKNIKFFSSISDYDILDLSKNDSNFKDLANDFIFWRDRALVKGYISKIEDFGYDEEWPENNNGIRTPQERYLQLLSKTSCVPGSEKYIDNQSGLSIYDICLKRSGKEGSLDTVKYFLEKGGSIKTALHGAAHGGHLDLVKYLIDEKGSTDFNEALWGASEGGNLDLVKYLIEEKKSTSFNLVIYKAAQGGYIDLVKYSIEKGAYDFDNSLRAAAEGGHLDLVKYLVSKGANIYCGLYKAAQGGHLEVVKYLIDEKGAAYVNNALAYAAFGGYLDLVKYLIDEKGGTNLNDALAYAAKGGHLDLVKYLIDEKGADFFTDALNYAIRAGKIEIVKYLIEEKKARIFYINSSLYYALIYKHLDIFLYLYDTNKNTNTNINIDNEVLPKLASDGLLEMVKYLIEGKYANDLNQTLKAAANKKHLNIVKYLIEEKGVTNFYNSDFIEKNINNIENKYIADFILLYNAVKSKDITNFTSASKNLNNTQIIDVLTHYVNNKENIDNLINIINIEQLFELLTNLHNKILDKIEKDPDSATNIRKIINTSLNVKGPDPNLIEMQNQIFYLSGRPRTSMSFLKDFINVTRLPEAQIVTAREDNLLIADISLGEHIEPLLFQVLRYASGMSRGIYHQEDVAKKYCGTFYYYDIGSDIYLLSNKTLVANNKLDAMSKMFPEKSLEQIILLSRNNKSTWQNINKEDYINVKPELFENIEDFYAIEDFLDQPLCIRAKELGYDCIILLKMAGKERLVTEVLDARDRVKSFKNIYKYIY